MFTRSGLVRGHNKFEAPKQVWFLIYFVCLKSHQQKKQWLTNYSSGCAAVQPYQQEIPLQILRSQASPLFLNIFQIIIIYYYYFFFITLDN